MKLSRFWKIYIFSVAAALLVLIVGLSVFYAFIASYEKSQPEYAVREYATTLTDDGFADILEEINIRPTSKYETDEQLEDLLLDAFKALDGDFAARKNYKKYSSDAPVFSLIKDSVTVADIYLESTENGLFGMKRWQIADVHILAGNIIPPAEDYSICVPKDAVLTVNGTVIQPENITEQIPYPFKSIYKPNSTASWDVYTVSDLFGKPDITCVLDGVPCAIEEEGNTYRIRYPEDLTTTYTITVPNEAVVTVNGIPLKPDCITTDFTPYEYSVLKLPWADFRMP